MNDPKKLNPPFSLNNIDLNNIDVDQIVATLTQYKSAVLMGAVIVGTLIIAWMMYNAQCIKEQGLRTQISQLQDKLDVITRQRAAVKNLNDFKSSFSAGIDDDKIITQITSYAKAHGVSISSLAPGMKQDMGLYDISSVDLVGVARNYKEMVRFLRDMEMSKFLFKLESWVGHISGTEDAIQFNLTISVMHVHL